MTTSCQAAIAEGVTTMAKASSFTVKLRIAKCQPPHWGEDIV